MLWKKERLSRLKTFLVLSYLGNYLPFFFISRKMFLYHYFPALLFSFLLVPIAFSTIWPYLERKIPNLLQENGERILFFSVLAISAIMFLSISPMTYGF